VVYKDNIPQANDFLSKSQLEMLANHQEIQDAWGRIEDANIGDHISLSEPEVIKRGGHKKTTLIEQGADPSTGADEIALYSKETDSLAEIHYRQESDGSTYQLTSKGGVNVGGLVLRAYVLFDLQGTIIEIETLDEEGNVVKTPASYNIDSITANSVGVSGKNVYGDFTIAYENDLPTDDYIWVLQSYNRQATSGLNFVINVQPKSGTYAATVTKSLFNVFSYYVPPDGFTFTPAGPVPNRIDRILFQAYTVA